MKNDEKNFRKFRRGPIFLAALFLAASCLGFFFIFRKINENKTVAADALGAWMKEDARRAEIKSLDAFLQSVQEERAYLDLHFAQSSNVVPFLDSLEDLGRRAGAKPEVTSVETVPAGGGLLVALKAQGSFESVYKFLELMENSQYELEFMALELSRMSEDDAGAGWEGFFKIKLLTFLP